MVDYDMGGLGDYGRGTMKMRDHGYYIEFFVHVAWSSTNWGSVGWSYTSPNGNGSGSFGYPGGQVWKHVGTIGVSSSGYVSWTVNATGTSEFRGPHTQTVYIQRATVPPAPTLMAIDQIEHQRARVIFHGNGDGGSTILEWQITFSNIPSGRFETPSSGTTTLDLTGSPDFPPGGDLYVWARGRNAVGWSGYSNMGHAKLLPGGKVRVGGVWKNAIPYVKVNGVWRPAVPYVRKDGVWVSTTY